MLWTSYYIGWIDFLLFVVTFLLATVYYKTKEYSNRIPGPFAFPVIGNLPQMSKQVHVSLHQMRKKYGDIFRVYFGSQPVIVVCGNKLVNECLLSRSELFSMRPEIFSAKYVINGKSFVFSQMDPKVHKQYRKLAMTAIKKSVYELMTTNLNGMNAHLRSKDKVESGQRYSSLENIVVHDAVILGRKLVHLSTENRKTFEFSEKNAELYLQRVYRSVLTSTVSIMCCTVLGKRYSPEDQQLDFLVDILLGMRNIDKKITLLNFIPILRKVWKHPINTFIGINKAYYGLMKMHVTARKRLIDKNSSSSGDANAPSETDLVESHSITDNLLRSKICIEGDEELKDEMHYTIVADIFGASVDTTSTIVMWMMIYFAAFSESTKIAQDQIDEFVDKNHRLPKILDSLQLPFVLAFITEILRHCSFIPFAIPHAPVRDTQLGGYSIPQGQTMLISLWSLNHDPDTWGDHQVFRPNRFITETNEFDKSVAAKVNVHGLGRRQCAGLNFSQITLFMIPITLLHTFNFGVRNANEPVLPAGIMRSSLSPETFNVTVSERGD